RRCGHFLGRLFPRLSGGLRKVADRGDRGDADPFDRRDLGAPGRRSSRQDAIIMNVMMLYGVCAAAIGALGLYGLIVNPQPLRKILALNVLGSGIFLLFGVIARRGTAAGLGGDPVPQAMIITAIVVAFSA